MKNVILATTAMLSLLSCTEERKQPNIVFILADDMGYGDVSCFDHRSKLKTEHIDRMAQEGVVLPMRIPAHRSVHQPDTVF